MNMTRSLAISENTLLRLHAIAHLDHYPSIDAALADVVAKRCAARWDLESRHHRAQLKLKGEHQRAVQEARG